MHIADRLNHLLNQSEEQVSELEGELDRIKAEHEAYFRGHRLSDEENLNLPVPRLEVRYVGLPVWHSDHDNGRLVRIGLVYNHSQSEIICIPFGHTWQGQEGLPVLDDISECIPFTQHGFIIRLMEQFPKMPCYIVAGRETKSIYINGEGRLG